MKLDLFETHDRLLHFTKQDFSISDCLQDLIDQRPYGNHAFYVFAHPRTSEDGTTKRLIWQPRLTKPKAQTNSMLFKVHPGTDQVKIIWMIPARELWAQFKRGNVGHNQVVYDSIMQFENDRESLEKNEPDDLPDSAIEAIYRQIAHESLAKKAAKQATSAACQDSSKTSVT